MKYFLKIKKVISWFFVLMPVFIHLFVLDRFSLNFPFEDDHRVFLDFSYNYLNASSVKEKIAFLLTPDNESRPFLIRLSLLVPLSIFKSIDFKIILYFANIYTLILLGVFLKKYKDFPLLSVVISFTLLSLGNWELYFRNDVASYQLASVSLSVLLFYLITLPICFQNSSIKFLFYICLFIVPFGSALGFVTVFLLMLYSYIKKTKTIAVSILLLFIIQVVIYQSYSSGPGTTTSLFDNIIKYNFELILAYFISLGGQFRFLYNNAGYFISGFLGVITFLISMYFLLKNHKSDDYDFEKLVFVFASSSLAIIVLSRYNYWIVGYDSILNSRYKIYGILVFLVGASFIFKLKIAANLKIIFTALSILFYVFWFIKSWSILILKNETQMIDAYNIEKRMINYELSKNAFEPKYKYEYLKSKGYFNANKLYHNVLLKIKKGIVIYPDKAVLKFSEFDPAFESDWSGKKNKLRKIILYGKFPVSDTYFIKLTDINQKSIILNGFKRPTSRIKRFFEKEKEVDFLLKEFEFEFYNLQKPLTSSVICVKN